MMLLPPSLEELIEENHPVRTVNSVIDSIDLAPLESTYKGGGTSSYHPRMLLKVLIYGYLTNIFSSRKIETSLNENIHFMWLSGMSRPDHNTINRFRSDRLKEVLKPIFCQIVLLLAEAGHVNIKQMYSDGTKIEANANRYTFVWGRAISKSKERMKSQLEELWAYTQSVAKDELSEEDVVFDEISKEKLEETVSKIDQALEGKDVDKKVKQKLRYIKRNWPSKLDEYEEKEAVLGQRNSSSKTDPDATFMRMKDDHMRNGQLKPAYNLQFSTSDQFIINYTLHQDTTDTNTLIPHLEQYKLFYGDHTLEKICADSGYGSEENYEYLEDSGIAPFVKYNYFHKEQKEKVPNPYLARNLYYNEYEDCVYCPMGQRMENIGTVQKTTKSGYKQIYTRYQAKNCRGCPFRGVCYKAKGNRIIEINHKLNRYRSNARELLLSPEGIEHRKKRPCDVEATFGIVKQNKGFRRFMLRGLEKVEIETGLIAIAHNLAKMGV